MQTDTCQRANTWYVQTDTCQRANTWYMQTDLIGPRARLKIQTTIKKLLFEWAKLLTSAPLVAWRGLLLLCFYDNLELSQYQYICRKGNKRKLLARRRLHAPDAVCSLQRPKPVPGLDLLKVSESFSFKRKYENGGIVFVFKWSLSPLTVTIVNCWLLLAACASLKV